MPVKEISGAKLIVRVSDTENLVVEAQKFMHDRLMPHLNDGEIWVIPFFDHELWKIDKEALDMFGFEFFERVDFPFEERPWAIRRDVEFIDGESPKHIVLWMNSDLNTYEFNNRKFVISDG